MSADRQDLGIITGWAENSHYEKFFPVWSTPSSAYRPWRFVRITNIYALNLATPEFWVGWDSPPPDGDGPIGSAWTTYAFDLNSGYLTGAQGRTAVSDSICFDTGVKAQRGIWIGCGSISGQLGSQAFASIVSLDTEWIGGGVGPSPAPVQGGMTAYGIPVADEYGEADLDTLVQQAVAANQSLTTIAGND